MSFIKNFINNLAFCAMCFILISASPICVMLSFDRDLGSSASLTIRVMACMIFGIEVLAWIYVSYKAAKGELYEWDIKGFQKVKGF